MTDRYTTSMDDRRCQDCEHFARNIVPEMERRELAQIHGFDPAHSGAPCMRFPPRASEPAFNLGPEDPTPPLPQYPYVLPSWTCGEFSRRVNG